MMRNTVMLCANQSKLNIVHTVANDSQILHDMVKGIPPIMRQETSYIFKHKHLRPFDINKVSAAVKTIPRGSSSPFWSHAVENGWHGETAGIHIEIRHLISNIVPKQQVFIPDARR